MAIADHETSIKQSLLEKRSHLATMNEELFQNSRELDDSFAQLEMEKKNVSHSHHHVLTSI